MASGDASASVAAGAAEVKWNPTSEAEGLARASVVFVAGALISCAAERRSSLSVSRVMAWRQCSAVTSTTAAVVTAVVDDEAGGSWQVVMCEAATSLDMESHQWKSLAAMAGWP